MADLDEFSDDDYMEELIKEEALNNYDIDLDNVSKTPRYMDIMNKVEDALATNPSQGLINVLEDDDQLIDNCTALCVDIENEISKIHYFIRDKYRLKFPELESVVHNPIDYARIVKKIGNEMDMTRVDFRGILPSATIMMVSVITASTTTSGNGKPLPEDVLQKVIDACDRALALDSAKKKVVDFVESRIGCVAPNLSAIVGSRVAAKLIGKVGGIWALAKTPAYKVQLLGVATNQCRVGFLEQTEISQTTPPSLRERACRILAEKCTLAARVDSTRRDPTGKTGKSLRAVILRKIEKMLEPKKKRGGGRLRKKKVAKKFKFESYGISGLTSCIPFTALQGIELPNREANGLASGTQSTYFSKTAAFSKIKRTT